MEKTKEIRPILDDSLIGQYIFLDQKGLGKLMSFGIEKIDLVDNGSFHPNYLFVQNKQMPGSYIRLDQTSLKIDEIKALFRKGIHVYKPNAMSPWGNPQPTDQTLELKKIASITMKIRLSLVHPSERNLNNYSSKQEFSTSSDEYRLEFESEEEFEKVRGLVMEPDFQVVPVPLEKLKVKDEVFYSGSGKATVTALSENAVEPFCELMLFDGRKVNIERRNINSLFYLPYEKHEDEFEVLRKSERPARLSATLVPDHDHQLHTLYWLPIEEAARYIVSLFACTTSPYGQCRLYHLQDIEIERGIRYLSLPPLTGGFCCKVIAEDRSGKQIAVSETVKGYRH